MIDISSALILSARSLYSLQSGPCAFGPLRLLFHDHVRLDLLRDAACSGARMAFSQSRVATLLAGSDRLWDLLRFPDDRWRLAGHRHARPRAAVHGFRSGPDALSAGEDIRRRSDDGGTHRLRVPLLRHGPRSSSAPIRQFAAWDCTPGGRRIMTPTPTNVIHTPIMLAKATLALHALPYPQPEP